jgi:hypothetical protein
VKVPALLVIGLLAWAYVCHVAGELWDGRKVNSPQETQHGRD